MTERVAALIRVNDDLLSAHPDLYGHDPVSRCMALAEALTCSPAWAALRRDAHIVVRPESGVLGVLGSVPSDRSALVSALGWQVDDLLRRLRPVTYREVEAACVDLADGLRQYMTPDQIANARLIGIPRGGLIVAGMLAYALQTRRTEGRPGTQALTIVVDDCALSGLRLREALEAQEGKTVVVALLHAHPDLCHEVEALEPGVSKCLSARQLTDHAHQKADYGEWKKRWAERTPEAYWIGDPDHLCYPWNEPDVMVWNPVIEHAQGGWRVVPPSWCVKNRVASRVPDLQRCTWINTDFTPGDGVVWADAGERILLAAYGNSKVVALRGTAAAMWRSLVSSPGIAHASQAISSEYGVNIDSVRGDMDAFIAKLTERGLLHRGDRGH